MRRIQFSDFEIDLDLYTLTRKGKPVEIGPHPLNLLICLIENRDRVLDREFIRREVWDSADISESTIPTSVLAIRKALQDDAAAPRFIESKRGRGYRFICDVKRVGPRHAPSTQGKHQFEFVGRREEMAALRSISRSVIRDSHGKIVLVEGEAGIGKTRLLEEFVALVGPEFSAHTATSPAIAGLPPFSPWIQLVNGALNLNHSTHSDFTEEVRLLSRTFPEIQTPQNPSPNGKAQADRHSVFSRWSRAIRSISNSKPTIVAFEDAHRADPDSLRLLYWIADEIGNTPIMLVITHRPSPAKDENEETLQAISRMPHASQLHVPPLTKKEISILVDPLTRDPEKIAQDIESRTGGNAFFATHLARNFDSIQNLESKNLASPGIPLNGREIVARQLSDLPDFTRSALSAASVIGDRFPPSLVAKLLTASHSKLLADLEPAIRTWLIFEDGPEYRFNHSLLRDALYSAQDSNRRKELHLRAARELQLLPEASETYPVIADHLLSALPLGNPQEARKYAMLAAREAASRFAYSRAAEYLDKALATTKGDPQTTIGERYEITLELGRSTLYSRDPSSARQILIEASHLARNLRSPQRLAECALSLSPDFLTIQVGVHDPTLIQLLEEALVSVSAECNALRAQLHARLAQAQQWSDTRERLDMHSRRALEYARASSDQSALLAALSARSEAFHGPHLAEQRLSTLAELGSTADKLGHIPAKLLQNTKLITAYLELGEIRKVEHVNEEYRILSGEMDLPQFRWYPGATDCMLAMLRGEMRDAEFLAERYKSVAGDYPDHNFVQTFGCQKVLRDLEQDRSASALPRVVEFSKRQKNVLSWAAAVPWFQLDCGSIAEAQESLETFSQSDILNMMTEPGGGVGIALLAEVTATIGSRRRAEFLLDLLRPILDRCASAGYGVAYFGSFSRYAGLLTAALGDLDKAASLLQHASSSEARRGARSWHAYAEIDLLKILRKAGRHSKTDTERVSAIGRSISGRGLVRAERRIAELSI